MPNDTFASIAAGYNAQTASTGIGGYPGSFQPMDGMGGGHVPFPTPQPQYTRVAAHTMPFPQQNPGFHSPQMPMMSPAMSGGGYQFTSPAAHGMFAPPTQYSPPQVNSPGFFQDAMTTYGFQRPGAGQNFTRSMYEANERHLGRMNSYANTAGQVGRLAAGVGSMFLPTGYNQAAGGALIAESLTDMYMSGRMADQRAHQGFIGNQLGNITGGGMVNAFGRGIDPMASLRISQQLQSIGKTDSRFKENAEGGDLTTTLSMASDRGLMRGHTRSVSETVSRIKSLAVVAKDLMDLGEGITQQDAMDLMSLTQQMGISAGSLKSQGLGRKIATAARVAGTTMTAMAQDMAHGSAAFQQAGLSTGLGARTVMSTQQAAAGMVDSGALSAAQVARFGGQSGMSNSLMQGTAGYLMSSGGSLLFGATTPGSMGLSYDPTKSHLPFGHLSRFERERRGRDYFRGTKDNPVSKMQRRLREMYFEEDAPDQMRRMQEDMTPEQVQMMVARDSLDIMRDMRSKGRPVTMKQAMGMVGVQGEQADAMIASFKTLGQQRGVVARQERVTENERLLRGSVRHQDRHSGLTRLGEAVGEDFANFGNYIDYGYGKLAGAMGQGYTAYGDGHLKAIGTMYGNFFTGVGDYFDRRERTSLKQEARDKRRRMARAAGMSEDQIESAGMSLTRGSQDVLAGGNANKFLDRILNRSKTNSLGRGGPSYDSQQDRIEELEDDDAFNRALSAVGADFDELAPETVSYKRKTRAVGTVTLKQSLTPEQRLSALRMDSGVRASMGSRGMFDSFNRYRNDRSSAQAFLFGQHGGLAKGVAGVVGGGASTQNQVAKVLGQTKDNVRAALQHRRSNSRGTGGAEGLTREALLKGTGYKNLPKEVRDQLDKDLDDFLGATLANEAGDIGSQETDDMLTAAQSASEELNRQFGGVGGTIKNKDDLVEFLASHGETDRKGRRSGANELSLTGEMVGDYFGGVGTNQTGRAGDRRRGKLENLGALVEDTMNVKLDGGQLTEGERAALMHRHLFNKDGIGRGFEDFAQDGTTDENLKKMFGFTRADYESSQRADDKLGASLRAYRQATDGGKGLGQVGLDLIRKADKAYSSTRDRGLMDTRISGVTGGKFNVKKLRQLSLSGEQVLESGQSATALLESLGLGGVGVTDSSEQGKAIKAKIQDFLIADKGTKERTGALTDLKNLVKGAVIQRAEDRKEAGGKGAKTAKGADLEELQGAVKELFKEDMAQRKVANQDLKVILSKYQSNLTTTERSLSVVTSNVNTLTGVVDRVIRNVQVLQQQ